MMAVAFQIGIDPLTFWELTPRELSVLVEAFEEKSKREQEAQLTTAYLTAYWHRVKKMPSLKEVLGIKKKEKRKQTAEEMLETVKRLNEMFGGSVKG
jgi:hypothetical protein